MPIYKGDTPIVEASGRKGKDGKDGINGIDGYSPTIEVNKVDKTTVLTITDINGTKTIEIKDGESPAVDMSEALKKHMLGGI